MSVVHTKLTDKSKTFIWVRLLWQADGLLKATTFSPKIRDAILTVCAQAAPRLARCQDIRDGLAAYEERYWLEYKELRSAETRYFPKLEPIEGEAERFLYEAKNYLRDLTGILRAVSSASLLRMPVTSLV